MRDDQSPILFEDRALAEHLSERRRPAAERDCIARVIRVRAGAWAGATEVPLMRYGIGLLVLEGLLLRRVGLEGRFGAELLGAGDLLRPWQHEDAETPLPHAGGWEVLAPSRMAVLDSAFTIRLTRYPEVTAALFGRAVRRSRYLAVNMAIVHQPRIDVRLHMLFWVLADRWGTVGRDGALVPMRLTHGVLSELVAARRPSVSKALKELAARSAVRWTGEAWQLQGRPPAELGEVQALALPRR